MVRLDNFGHDVINFRDMRRVDVLTQNPVQAGDSFIRSSKSRELVHFLPHVAIRRNEIISFDELGQMVGLNCRNTTTVFQSMTSLCSGALKSPHILCRSRDGMLDINVKTQS